MMTFYEAAVEVLRKTGRPLHFKKITEVAIRDELLSHVGKTPEVTMGTRLDQEVKKQNGSWIVKTRPGVYMLKEDVLDRLNEEAKERQEKQRKKQEQKRARKSDEQPRQEKSQRTRDRDDSDDSGDSDDSDERRRRRRRRGGDDDDTSGKRARSGDGDGRGGDKSRSGGRSEGKVDISDLEGERCDSIAEAAYTVLAASNKKPLSVDRVADIIFDKKLVKFHTHDPEATVHSAIVTDNQVRTRQGRRPLFAAYSDNRWGLTEWGVSDEGIKREQQIQKLAGEIHDGAVEQLGDSLIQLKPEAFEMVVITLLERLDYSDLKVSKRTSEGDVFFTADWQRGFSDLRVCIQIVFDSDARVDADTIKELRETLNHYSAAEGVLIHLGEVTRNAIKESRDDDKDKITVLDNESFVELLIEHGIGVTTFQTPIVMVDNAFIEALSK